MKFNPKSTYTTTIKQIKNKNVNFGISNDALTLMQKYVEGCTDEIGWFFTVEKDEEYPGWYFIEDCILFHQEVHSTTTEVNGDNLIKLSEEILSKPDGVEFWNKMKGWGHSHVNMGVTPSGQDDNQMEFFSNSGFDFFVRIIANKKGELKIDLYDYSIGVAYIDVPWTVYSGIEERELASQIVELQKQIEAKRLEKESKIEEEVEKEIKAKVRKIVYQSTAYKGTGYFGSGYTGKNKVGDEENFQMTGKNGTTAVGSIDKTPASQKEGKRFSFKKMSDALEEFTYNELVIFACTQTRGQLINAIEKVRPNCVLTNNSVNFIIDASEYAINNGATAINILLSKTRRGEM